MNMPKLVADLLDRLERANWRQPDPELREWSAAFNQWRTETGSGPVSPNHPDLVAARAEVIELQNLVKLRDEQIVGLKNGAAGASAETQLRRRVRELEAEKHTMAGIISGLRVWQIAAKNLLKRQKVAKRLWPKEPKPT